MIRVAAVGEAMIELTHRDDETLGLSYAGDTYNTATYLARVGGTGLQVDYITRVGTDWYSDQMLCQMEREGVGTARIERVEGGTPGLYLVRTGTNGERSFTYHRSNAPARGLFGSACGPGQDEAFNSFDVVYLSAISLQILSAQGRERLWAALDAARRRGCLVVFDTNYRPAGWDDPTEARTAIETTLRRSDMVFPTFDDEQQLFGDANPAACARRIAGLGVAEVVVKDGEDGCIVRTGSVRQNVPAETVTGVVDTTGAGDSFNAGYLAARLNGSGPYEAALAGHRLAAQVIRYKGAIIPFHQAHAGLAVAALS